MFKVVEITSLLWPVTIIVPREDGSGEHDEHQVKVKYKVYETDGLLEEVDGQSRVKDLKIIDQILGWDDIYEADGSPMPFTKANLKKVFKTPYIARAFIDGFWLCQEGYQGKNS